jgi:hypothetical protein
MACELTARMQMLALDGPAWAWGPKWLRLSLFTCAVGLVRGAHSRAWPPPGPRLIS